MSLAALLHRQYKTARTELVVISYSKQGRGRLRQRLRAVMFYSAVPQGTHENPKIVCRLRTHPAECSKLGKTQIIADAKRGVVRNAGFCGQIYRRLLHLELIPASAPIINLLPLCQPFLCQFFFPSVTESVCSSYCPLEDLWMVTSTVVPAL